MIPYFSVCPLQFKGSVNKTEQALLTYRTGASQWQHQPARVYCLTFSVDLESSHSSAGSSGSRSLTSDTHGDTEAQHAGAAPRPLHELRRFSSFWVAGLTPRLSPTVSFLYCLSQWSPRWDPHKASHDVAVEHAHWREGKQDEGSRALLALWGKRPITQ